MLDSSRWERWFARRFSCMIVWENECTNLVSDCRGLSCKRQPKRWCYQSCKFVVNDRNNLRFGVLDGPRSHCKPGQLVRLVTLTHRLHMDNTVSLRLRRYKHDLVSVRHMRLMSNGLFLPYLKRLQSDGAILKVGQGRVSVIKWASSNAFTSSWTILSCGR